MPGISTMNGMSCNMARQLETMLDRIPAALAAYRLDLSDDGTQSVYTYDAYGERDGT